MSAEGEKQLGDTHLAARNWGEAARHYRAAIDKNPHYAKAHASLGFVLMEVGQFDVAEASLLQALVLDSNNADTHYMLGMIARNVGRLDAADQYCRRAVELADNFDVAFSDWYEVMRRLARMDEVIQFLIGGIERSATRADFHRYLGMVYNDQENSELAADSLRKSLVLDPEHADTLAELGLALSKQGSHDQAQAAYRDAIALFARVAEGAPEDCAAQVRLAAMLTAQNRVDEAYAVFDRALAIDATHGEARLGRGWICLLRGEYEQGWRDYKDIARFNGIVRYQFGREPWLNDADIDGKSIFVYADQGMGDAIQFARFVNQLGKMGAKVYLEVHALLAPLFQSLQGVTQILQDGDVLPAVDYHCPMSNLCLAFNAGVTPIPAAVPYLSAPSDRLAYWADNLRHCSRQDVRHDVPHDSRPRIGVVWSGNPLFKSDKHRSILLQTFSALFTHDRYQFFSLQKDVRPHDAPILAGLPHVINLDAELRDFAETAAVIANLDLVITVDTAVAHLAGALGKPVWILLPFAPDFRWLLQRDDTPWYPTARLFRQPAIGDWGSVIREVRSSLDSLSQ